MRCNGSGCNAVPGATGPTYTLSGNDVGDQFYVQEVATNPGGNSATVNSARSPVVMGTSTVSLAVTPGTPVTDQGVTLIATITSGAAIAPTTGSITFNNGNGAITGCSNVAVPARQIAIVTCEASFGASTAQLSANFVPAKGSLLLGSSSSTSLVVGQAATKLSLAIGAVHLGSNTTFTATVDPPGNSTGTILPTGRVEFFDKGVPIAKCHNQLVTRGVAKCQVRYTRLRMHHIMAKYGGDSNFSPSHSPTQLVKVGAIPPSGVVGALMSWKFAYHAVIYNHPVVGHHWAVARRRGGDQLPGLRVPVQPFDGKAQDHQVRQEVQTNLLDGECQLGAALRRSPSQSRDADHGDVCASRLDRQVLPVHDPPRSRAQIQGLVSRRQQ